MHQDSGRSYKEVCAPVIERCYFLINEIRPAVSEESGGSTRLLTSNKRWKVAITSVIKNIRETRSESYLFVLVIQSMNQSEFVKVA